MKECTSFIALALDPLTTAHRHSSQGLCRRSIVDSGVNPSKPPAGIGVAQCHTVYSLVMLLVRLTCR